MILIQLIELWDHVFLVARSFFGWIRERKKKYNCKAWAHGSIGDVTQVSKEQEICVEE